MKTSIDRVPGGAVIHIEGDLTAAAQNIVDDAFAIAATGTTPIIVVAFREPDHINSAGVGILIGLVMQCRKTGQTMRFSHPSSHFRKIFDIVGLNHYVEIFPSLEEALADVPSAQRE